MQQLVKMPEIQKTMMEMSKEMMKVNIIIYITKEVYIICCSIPVLPEYEFIIIQYFQAGIMEEMMEDTMESLEPEDLEEDIQLEVDKILSELTADKSSKVKPGIKTQDSIRLPEVPGSSTIRDEEPAEEEEEVEEDLAEMQSRLQALRS